MNNIKFLSVSFVLLSAALGGCSKHSMKTEQLSSKVETTNTTVDQLNTDVSALRSDLETTKKSADHAHQRLDQLPSLKTSPRTSKHKK